MKKLLVGALFALASFAEALDGKWSREVQAPPGGGDAEITEGTISGDEVNGQERQRVPVKVKRVP